MRFRPFGLLAAICVILVCWSQAAMPAIAQNPRHTITKTNILQLKQIASLGQGQINTVVWSPNSRWVAVATTSGVWLYDSIAPQTEPIHFGSTSVKVITFSKDNKLISSAGWNTNFAGVLIQTWNIETQQQILRLEDRHLNFADMVFSPAGDVFGVFRSDGSAQLWRIPSGDSIATFQLGSFWETTGIAISPDDAFIGVTGENSDNDPGKLIVRSTGLKREPPVTPDRTGFFLFSPDGKYLTASLGDIKLFNADTGTLVSSVESSRISRIKTWDDGSFGRNFSYSEDSSRLAVITGEVDDTIRLWNVHTRTTERLLTGHTKEVSAVELSANGQLVFSSSFDGTVRVWDAMSGKQNVVINGNNKGHYAVFASPDARKIVSPDVNGDLWLWDAGSGALLARWNGFLEEITSGAFSPDGLSIAIGSASETVNGPGSPWAFGIKPYMLRIWNWKSNTSNITAAVGSDESNSDLGITALAYTPEGNMLCVVTYSLPRQYETTTLRLITPITKLSQHLDAVTSDGQYFIAFGSEPDNWQNGIVTVYQTATLGQVAAVSLPNRQLDRVHSSSNDGFIAINTYQSGTEEFALDGQRTIVAFDIASNRIIQQFAAPYGNMEASAISRNKQLLATGGQRGSVYFWDIATGLQTQTIATGTLAVQKLLFNADGSLLFVITDQNLVVYDVQTLAKIRQFDLWPRFLTLSQDGSLLATGAEDGTVMVWAVE